MSAPTRPGWWWRGVLHAASHVTRVDLDVETGALVWGPSRYPICNDGLWLCEVPTPERIAADAERLERYADALTRIEGGDFPISDGATLRRIAYSAIMGVDE